MSQTVYLNAPGVRRVNLEGPALRIQSRDQADQFLPLARLGRVVSRGAIQWSTPALIHCLQAGITVTFLDRQGRLLGMGVGAWPRDSRLSEMLDHFFSLDEGPQRLVDWFRSQSRKGMLALLRRHDIQPPDLRVKTVRLSLRQIWARHHPSGGPAPVGLLKPLAAAQVAEILARYRIHPAVLEPGQDWEGLTRYLTGLLEWPIWERALNGDLILSGTAFRARAACYQRHQSWFGRQIQMSLERLRRWLDQSEAYLP